MAALSELMGIGGVTDGSARYRARADGAATIKIEYSTNSDLSGSTISTGVSIVSDDDFTGGEELAGLSAATTYHYSILIDDVRAHSAPFPYFRTHPVEGVDAAVRIIFGSCQNSGSHATIFEAIKDEDPDLFIHLGDYGYPNTTDLALLRSSYRTQFGGQWQTHVVNAIAREHVWDDHDYDSETNNGDSAGKANARQAFDEYLPSHTFVNTTHGIWRTFWVGNAQFWLLDVRSQREGVKQRFPSSSTRTADTGSTGSTLVLKSSDSPSASDDAYNTWYAAITVSSVQYIRRVTDYVAATRSCTLSEAVPGLDDTSTYLLRRASILDMDAIEDGQTDWLIAGVLASGARWKFICTSVGWNRTLTAATDTWGGFDTDQCERKYIQQELADVPNVIVLSADLHRTAIDDGGNSIWPEFTCSPLNQSGGDNRGTWTHGTTTSAVRSYGVVDITASDVTLTPLDATGSAVTGVTPLVVENAIEDPPDPKVGWLRSA